MKIAIIAPTYLPARRANTIQVMKMAQAIAGLGNSVCVYVPTSNPKDKAEKYQKDHPDHIWNVLSQHYGLEHRFTVEWLLSHPRLRRYDYGIRSVRRAHRWGAELIYTRLPQAAAFSSVFGYQTIMELHDIPRGFFSNLLLQRFIKGKGALKLVVITRSLKNDLANRDKIYERFENILIAPDGVDLSRFTDHLSPYQARNQLFMPERFTVGYTGHLYAGRGLSLIVEVASRLPETTFLLVGGEPADIVRLQSIVEHRNLKNVDIAGFVQNIDLPVYQYACEVLMMPYQQRVAASSGGDIAPYLSPMKLFEYLACGRAILSSDLPVLREVLNSENSVLLPPDDVNKWVEAIKDLQNNPKRRTAIAERARQSAQTYSWDSRAKKLLENNNHNHV